MKRVRWGWVITFTSWPLCPRGKGCMSQLVRELYGSQGWSGYILLQITLCRLPRTLTTFFVERLAHSLITISDKGRVLWKIWRKGIIWEFKTITWGNLIKVDIKTWMGGMDLCDSGQFTECISWSLWLSKCRHARSVPLRPCSWLHSSDVTVSAVLIV